MMPTNQPPVDVAKTIDQIREIVTKKESGIIVLPAKATPDAIAAGTSLYLGLTQLGKQVALVSSVLPESDMIGADKIKTDLQTGGDSLVVSFPYTDGAIDKVDYNIKGERFNLIIVPREGNPKLEPNDVQFTYTGGAIDYIITIDTPNLNAIGELYQKNQRDFEGKTIINIDRHLVNASYGMVNLVVKTSSSTSELIFKVLQGLKVKVDRDIATNLYNGILTATNNFTAYSVNADTFDSIAELMRAGAVKKAVMQAPGGQFGRALGGFGAAPSLNPFGAPAYPQGGMGGGFGSFPQVPQQQQQQQPFQQSMQMPRQPQPVPQPFVPDISQRKLKSVEKEVRTQEGAIDEGETAEDQLKPRIFSDDEGMM